jgi:hypothetical protein
MYSRFYRRHFTAITGITAIAAEVTIFFAYTYLIDYLVSTLYK